MLRYLIIALVVAIAAAAGVLMNGGGAMAAFVVYVAAGVGVILVYVLGALALGALRDRQRGAAGRAARTRES